MSNEVVEVKQAGIKGLVGVKMTKKVDFMGVKLLISKLSVSEVLSLQERSRELEEKEKAARDIERARQEAIDKGEVYAGPEPEDVEEEGFEVLKLVIRAGAENAKDLSDEEFEQLPLDELTNLTTEIMRFSGIGANQGK
jgi:hypothetical protein